MQREYEKIRDKLKILIPMENILKQARTIENLHILIKNNGKDFNLTEEFLAYKKEIISHLEGSE